MNDAPQNNRPADPTSDTPVGEWPEPTSMASVVGSTLLWAAFVGFLVWMMVLRIQTS